MALTKCKECGEAVAGSARSCPHCGATRKRGLSCCGTVGCATLGIFLLIAFVGSWESEKRKPTPSPSSPRADDQVSTKREPRTSNTQRSVPRTPAWHEGGTLHKAVASEWLHAEYRNRLATSADFVAVARNFTSMEELRGAAIEMEACITQAAPAASARQRVNELAAVCEILLTHQSGQ